MEQPDSERQSQSPPAGRARRRQARPAAILCIVCAALSAACSREKTPAPVAPSLDSAIALIRADEFAAARDMLRGLTTVQTNSAPLFCNLGIALWRLGNVADAKAAWVRAADIQQDTSLPSEFLGRVLIDTHDYDAAVATLSEIASPGPRALTLLAMAHYRAGRADKAMGFLNQALDLDPRYPAARYDMAVLYRDVRLDAEGARRHYDAYRSLAPRHPLAARPPDAFVTANPRLAAALARLPPATTNAAPTNAAGPSPALTKARAAARDGDGDTAVFLYKQAIQENPGNPDALWEFADVYERRLGYPDRARELRLRFKQLFPQDRRAASVVPPAPPPGQSSADIFRKGLAAYERKAYGEAVSLYEKSLTLDPTSAGTAYNLGLARKAAGNARGAIEAFAKAVELRDDMTKARYMLGLTHMGEGNRDDALLVLNALLRQEPKYARAHFLLGMLYDEGKRPDLAAIHFRHYLELEAGGASSPYAKAWLQRHAAAANH